MQKSISILSSVNDVFEQCLDLLNSGQYGSFKFTIINVSTGWFYHIHPYPCYTYLVDFPDEYNMVAFSKWVLSNGF